MGNSRVLNNKQIRLRVYGLYLLILSLIPALGQELNAQHVGEVSDLPTEMQASLDRVYFLVDSSKKLDRSDYGVAKFFMLAEAFQLVDAVEKAQDTAMLRDMNRLMAQALWNLDAREEALHFSREMMRLSRGINDVMYCRHLGKIGADYLELELFDSALVHYTNFARIAKDLPPLWQSSSMNNLGILCEERGDYDMARRYYDSARVALNPIRNFQDSMLLVSIRDNEGSVLRKRGFLKEAEAKIREN